MRSTEDLVRARAAALERAAGGAVFVTSGVSGRGHQAVLGAAWQAIRAARAEAAPLRAGA